MKKTELNLIDKAVAFINPQKAVERLIARKKLTKFEYDAVKYTRERRGPSSLSGAEDYRSNYDRVELMKRARDLAENVGLVRSLLLKFAGHVAGSISYQARTLNPQINSDIEAYWAEWWDKCDITGRHTGSTLMQVAVMSMLRDGDFLFLLARDNDNNLKLQGIEADRLGDPYRTYTSLELIGGIHIDRNTGAPTAYDVFNRSIGDYYTYQATISASQAFHLFDPLRIDQYRGISAFHTAINDATDIHELTGFEKMSAKVASTQSAIVKRNNNNASDLSTLSNDEDFNGNQIKLESIESGKISYLEPGEDIVFPNGPSRPSGAFMEFHKVLMRNICLGLGIPYSFAVDPSQMSGPTARLEMQQAGRTFRRYQNLLNDKVLRPVKNIVLADAVARGLISGSEGSKTTKGIFNFGANVSIDLGRESASAIAEFKTGLRTASDIYAERGLDFESSLRQKAQEAALIKSLANEYDIPAVAISDIVESLVYAQQAAQRAGQSQEGADAQTQVVSDISLNGAQVASLINIINAVAAGALTRDGAISVITAAFPTISEEQARSIMAGAKEGEIIPTTKEERIATANQPQEVQAESVEDKKKELFEKLDAEDVKMLIAGMMGGIELGKYDGIDFTPPEGAREAAKRALDVRETKPASQRGMTPVGIARARDLINGVKFSPDTVRRMKAFFDRHEVDKKGATWDEQGKGWQAWNGWGGDAGYAWARKVVGQMEARDKKELAEPASCPIATQDIKTNLANRQTAVDDANYGPANPNEPNEDYWKAKADEFQGDIETAKKMLCGNCAAFDQRSKVLGCIKKGIGEDANEVAIGGNLGYCEIFDFKCAAKRTCDAWIVGGPMTDEKAKELARPGPKSAAQTPAPPKERIKGSKENPEGTAATRSKAGDIEISEANEQALKDKIAQFKKDHPKKNAPSLGTLKKVFRRGAGAYSTSFRPTITGGQPNSRNAWAMARVNKFLKMAGGGEVKESYRKADGDLLT
jgi:lambda family phage portal protein